LIVVAGPIGTSVLSMKRICAELAGSVRISGSDDARVSSPAHEAAHVALNQWIRTGGAFDGVVDADLVLRDPSQPTRLFPPTIAAIYLRPNTERGRAVAKSIDLKLLR
jgi:hypothetical protein